MLFTLALIASIVAGHPPRLPQKPWNLMVAVREEANTIWLTADYATEGECLEDLAMLVFTPTTRGRVVAMYCERAPFEV